MATFDLTVLGTVEMFVSIEAETQVTAETAARQLLEHAVEIAHYALYQPVNDQPKPIDIENDKGQSLGKAAIDLIDCGTLGNIETSPAGACWYGGHHIPVAT